MTIVFDESDRQDQYSIKHERGTCRSRACVFLSYLTEESLLSLEGTCCNARIHKSSREPTVPISVNEQVIGQAVYTIDDRGSDNSLNIKNISGQQELSM